MITKYEYLWVILLLLALALGQHWYLSRKLGKIFETVDNVEHILMEGTCD